MDAKCEEVTKSVEVWSQPYDHFDIINRVYEIKKPSFASFGPQIQKPPI